MNEERLADELWKPEAEATVEAVVPDVAAEPVDTKPVDTKPVDTPVDAKPKPKPKAKRPPSRLAGLKVGVLVHYHIPPGVWVETVGGGPGWRPSPSCRNALVVKIHNNRGTCDLGVVLLAADTPYNPDEGMLIQIDRVPYDGSGPSPGTWHFIDASGGDVRD